MTFDPYTAATDKLLGDRTCKCGYISCPTIATARCDYVEQDDSGDDIEKMLEDDRFNAEFRRVFS